MHEDVPIPANPRLTPRLLRAVHAEAYAWSLSCCRGRRDEALEVLQTAYVMVIEGRARYDGRSTPRTWLFGVIRNLARQHWRRWLRRARYDMALPEAEAPDPAPEPESGATHAALRAALQALPRRQREVLGLVFRNDLSLAEAADVLGISLGSARTHYERGKAALRAALAVDPGAAP